MQWTSRQTAVLASDACVFCRGFGIRSADLMVLCDCVYRAVFRSCYLKFRQCAAADPYTRQVSYERNRRGVDRRLSWARRNEDYCADFHLAGRRVLPRHLYAVFSYYHLHGARGGLLLRRLGVSRRTLTAWVAQAEVVVGRELAHMQPYSLFPPREYLHPAVPGVFSVETGENADIH